MSEVINLTLVDSCFFVARLHIRMWTSILWDIPSSGSTYILKRKLKSKPESKLQSKLKRRTEGKFERLLA